MTKETMYALVSWALALALAFGTWEAVQSVENFKESKELPAAGPPIPQSPDGLGALAGTAMQHDGRTALTRTIRMHMRETINFQENFSNIAAQRGWFAHGQEGYAISVVLPEDEMGELDRVSNDPTGWILKNRNPGLEARGPSNTKNLVNVRLKIEADGLGLYLTFTMITFAMAGTFFASCAGAFFTAVSLVNRHYRRETDLKTP